MYYEHYFVMFTCLPFCNVLNTLTESFKQHRVVEFLLSSTTC